MHELNWHTYANHLQELMLHLKESSESADITLMSEDETKFKAHKFVLSTCSSFFQSIFGTLPQNEASFIYLSGI